MKCTITIHCFMDVATIGLLLLAAVAAGAPGPSSATDSANASKAVKPVSLSWDRLLLLGFFGSLIVTYLAWFAYHIWQGTMGVLLWRLGVAPEAYACLNVASTVELITRKAQKYDQVTPAVILANRDLTDKDILRLAKGVRNAPEAGVAMLDLALNFGVSTDGIKALLQTLFEGKGKPSVVEEIDLSGLRIDPIAAGLFEAPLQQITLKGCGLDAKQLVGIMFRVTTAANVKKKCDSLSHLDLSFNDFGTMRLDVTPPPLLVLALESCNLRDVVIEALFGKGKLASSTLKEIKLSRNLLSDASAKLLALQLPDSQVEELDLRENMMTEKAFLPFLEVNRNGLGAWARVAFQGNDGIPDESIRNFHTKFIAPLQCEPCDS